ncbi:MAG TPA: bifunctional phosphoserine phosphatase/homoserine phosphotransferase ThrH [Treponemataceae bacterium]|jgi:phosphoserine/homoserine phosphotransferase|nr:bifunctional phosphoserine phosphatase/homoserine phosphotransferase ThrH [Treponemataceae bacterium]
MYVVCLDLEGVLVPEIWIEFSVCTGIDELKITTRDEPDYDKLMKYRIEILKNHGLKLPDIQRVISSMSPLLGAEKFVRDLRSRTQLIILSDTFTQFALPLMKKLEYPTLFCNDLIVGPDGDITGYALRQADGKKKAVAALKSINMKVFAAGDSYNDLGMISEANHGMLFRAPATIKAAHSHIQACDEYSQLLQEIDEFIGQ